MVETFINPVSLGSTGLMLTVLGYLMKKWVNGTSREISDLRTDKMDSKLCDSRREACSVCFDDIKKDMGEIKSKLSHLTDTVPVLTDNQHNVVRILEEMQRKTGRPKGK
jgi:hypothetical protein